ncbi:MAG TPA: branched-chain amino acid ABC transporter permease [Streptosporangiaceae bacterium]
MSAWRRLFPPMTPARWTGVAALVLLVAAFPLADRDQYVLSVIVTALVLLVLNISWNFVLGVAGVWNFGQLAIYALGGYGAGIIMLHTPLSPWLAVLGGGVIAALISVLLAFPTLLLYGIYTSLLTFSFAEIVQYVILNDGSGLTGGSFGFPIVPGLYSSLSPDAAMRAYYWTVLGVVVASTAGLAAVSRSHLGIAIRAVRDAPAYTAARGVSPLRYRVIAFAISGFLAGIAGALYISFNQSISPSAMGLTPMSIDVTMLVIGGLGTVFGPVTGAFFMVTLETYLTQIGQWVFVVQGAIFVICVLLFRRGIIGELAHLLRIRL